MGMLERFKDIMTSNINAMLDKVEDPSKLIDQYLRDAKRDLAEVRKETANVIADESKAQRNVDDVRNEVDKYTELAKKALVAGNREDAAVFVAEKQKLEAELVSYQEILAAANLNANQMREMHNKLQGDIENLESRKDILKGKIAATKARETVNKMGAHSNKFGTATGKISSMEDKVDKQFDSAMAESELLEGPGNAAKDLVSKYKGSSSASVEEELSRLEAEILSGTK